MPFVFTLFILKSNRKVAQIRIYRYQKPEAYGRPWRGAYLKYDCYGISYIFKDNIANTSTVTVQLFEFNVNYKLSWWLMDERNKYHSPVGAIAAVQVNYM